MEATREGFEQVPPPAAPAPDHDAMVAAGAEFKLGACYYRRATEEELEDVSDEYKSVAGKSVYIEVRETVRPSSSYRQHYVVDITALPCACRWTRKATLRWTNIICVRNRSAFKKETSPRWIPPIRIGSFTPSLGGTRLVSSHLI